MLLLDVRTAFFITGSLYFLMPLVVWLALREQRNRSVTLWCAGGELFGLGLLLISLRQHVPDWVSYDLASLCMHLGNVQRIQSLRQQLGQALPMRTLVALVLTFWLGYEAGRWLSPEGPYHFVWSCLAVAFQSLWIHRLAHRIAANEGIATAKWLGYAYVPLALLLILRAIQVTTDTALHGLLVNDYIPLMIALLGILAAVLGNTSFLGVFVERISRRQLAQAQERVRHEESARLGRQIIQLDRQRAMGQIAQSLAHELSQPLTNINLIAECAQLDLKNDTVAKPAFAAYFNDILRNTQNVVGILNRIRNFIKAKEVEFQPVTLQDVCTNVSHLMGDWLRSEQIQLQIHAPDTPMRVHGDAVQLAQILVNLVRNAGQATAGQPQRNVSITLVRQDAEYQVVVRDNGPGFSEQALQSDANAFYTTKVDGLGIGLSISRQIAEQHHGSLSLGNAPEGGALVSLNVPALLDASPETPMTEPNAQTGT